MFMDFPPDYRLIKSTFEMQIEDIMWLDNGNAYKSIILIFFTYLFNK